MKTFIKELKPYMPTMIVQIISVAVSIIIMAYTQNYFWTRVFFYFAIALQFAHLYTYAKEIMNYKKERD